MTLEADLAALEAAVLRGSPNNFLAAVDGLKLLVAQGSPASVLARKALTLESPPVELALLNAAKGAGRYGLADALTLLGNPVNRPALPPSLAVLELITGVDKAGVEAVAKTRKLIAAGAEPAAYLAPLYGHANTIRARATDVVNRAGNESVTDVADEAKLPTVWVAETNACVECLAYSGMVVKPGGKFPGGLTYGRKSYNPGSIKTPPRHPRCRCTVEPLVNQEYADALRREADRSVLRGFSLESESMGTRVDAADRLVKRGVDAPKSVIAYSRKAVKEGKFPTRGRPGDGPTPPTTPGKGPGFPPNAPKTPRPPTAPPSGPSAGDRLKATKAELARVKAERAALAKLQAEVDRKLAKRTIGSAKTHDEAVLTFSSKHPDVSTRGFESPDNDLATTRLALGELDRLLTKHPKTTMLSVTAAPIKGMGTLAQVSFSPGRYGMAPSKPWMTVNTSVMRKTPDQLEKAYGQHHGVDNHFHVLPAGRSDVEYTIAHEFGHVVDANLNKGARNIVKTTITKMLKAEGIERGTPEAHTWLRTNISGYGRTSTAEHFAEAFADVELNGVKATKLSRTIYDRAMKLLEELQQ